jgi:molybdopterin converting factor small subunit
MPTTVTVEFFGLVRHWTGAASLKVEAATLGQALIATGTRFPELVPLCIDGGELQPGFLANINSQRFTTDPTVMLEPGDAVLLISADVGG